MARLLYTVENLAEEVRSMLDEQNRDSVGTEQDILPALNRAQDYAFDIYARRYPQPILKHAELPLVGGQQEYDIPEDCFEDRLLKIEIRVPTGVIGSTYVEVQQISYQDLTNYESSSSTNIPLYYSIYGRKIRFAANLTGTYPARIWYLRSPEKIVLPQGRITVVNTVSNYIVVDQVGSGLTTEADKLGSYVNLVDGQTGEIKASLQIQSINSNNRITLRTVPSRAAVLNKAILGQLPATIQQDDYICAIDGSCVPYFGRPTSNFLIQYAVAEITRKLGGAADMENQVLDKFERQIEKSFAGRPQTLRVSKRSSIWGVPTRRYYWD